MKVVILAGGFGTRISEESHLKPKPMIEIGEKPILWHIMKYYSGFGYDDFIICLGYKSYVIKEFFSNYFLYSADITFDLANNQMEIHNSFAEKWKVTLVETGLNTMTGGRIKQIAKYIGNETFMLTYGDGVSNVDVKELLEFHQTHKKMVTLTTIQPEGRFGGLDIINNKVHAFREKSKHDTGWINGGFMVLNPDVFAYIKDDQTVFEQEPLEKIAEAGELMAYKHTGFWQCMDTQRDKSHLETIWQTGNAPWRNWK